MKVPTPGTDRFAVLHDAAIDIEPLVYVRDEDAGRDVLSLTPSQARAIGQALIEAAEALS